MFLFSAINSLATLRGRAKERSHTITLTQIIDAPMQHVFLFLTDRCEVEAWLGSVSIEVVGINHLNADAMPHSHDAGVAGRVKHPISLIFKADKADENGCEFTGEFVRIELQSQGKSATAVKLINSWNGSKLTRQAVKQARMAWVQWLSHIEVVLLSGARRHYPHPAVSTRGAFLGIVEA